jgi:hypothetical protein
MLLIFATQLTAVATAALCRVRDRHRGLRHPARGEDRYRILNVRS